MSSNCPPDIRWRTSEGHTELMGGDRLVFFKHRGGDAIDTTAATLEPFHDDEGHGIERDVSFRNHSPGNIYENGDELLVVIPESSPKPELGERFGITWVSPRGDKHTIGEHYWGQNYRSEVP